jgi:RHS repeat-associated protein
MSAQVLVTLDTGMPSSPTGLSAEAKEGGVVKLTWQAPSETSVAGYNLYRAPNAFTAPAQAVKVNSSLITGTTYSDLPPQEGTWYYRVTTKDIAGNESAMSNEVSAESDSTAPRATSIGYTPQGNYDPVTQRMAPGMVNLVLTVSEPLQVTPFFSITPGGGVPISVELTKDTDLTYTGFFVISDTTPTGTAYAIFSARDLAGNRGTVIDVGASIKIDTDGPAVRRLVVLPDDPIQNDAQSPVSVTVTLGLDEAIKSGSMPELSYLLSGQGRAAIAVDLLTQIAPQSGDVQTWQATFDLPADAGQTQTETFRFIYQGIDDLDNFGDRIEVKNQFQVYQGDLPPLEPPQGFKGKSLSGGRIQLSWNVVEEAVGYQLYRQAPDESELTDYQRIDTGLEYIDAPSVDGLYTYAVASIRFENDQEAISGLSELVAVMSDSTAPGAPINLSLELVSSGIEAEWDPPSYTEPITYSLYRADLPEITSVDGLTPLASGVEQTFAVDPNPSPAEHAYVVTSVDEAGNESAPSNSFYLNFELLPVSSLQVVQTDDDPPQVSWTHPGGDISGYDIYLGDKDDGVKLNSDRLTTLSFTDAGYSEDEREYTVIAVDDSQAESLGRSILLPVMRATLTAGTRIKRGIMNRLEYEVQNLSETWLDNIRLKVDVGGYSHTSDKFSINSGETIVIPVIVGGYDDLEDLVDLTTTVEIIPDANEKVEIVRTSQVEVVDGTLVLQILNEEFTRGGSGSVRFTLENTGQAVIEITTAKNSGNLPSDEITYYLLDTDENVISTMDFKQVFGDSVVTLSNGNTVARIPAGETFISESILVPVPANAPDDLTLKLAIAHIYYHQGQADQVKMNGLSGTHPVTLIETAYYGEVTSILPESSSGDQDIVITGRAIDRTLGDPLPGVPLKLVITLDGFDRKYEVFTDDAGTFAYTFTPFTGESGIYTVRAVHPDLTDRPVHGQFVINRVSIRPKTINLSIPVNYEQTVDIQVDCGDGTEANNLRLVYEEDDQPHGVFPEGVHITLSAPIAFLGSGQSGTLSFGIWADNTAAQTGSLVLKVKSDETGNDAWATLPVNTSFSEAQPVLVFTPDHVETGVAHDETITETIVLKNNGLEDMYDVSLALIHQDGSPAPPWAHLNASTDQGTLGLGESREISVSFSPTESVPEGIYPFYLRVTSSNYQTVDIGIYASVTLSGIGNVLFKVSDIYTGTLDAGEEPIQGLAGAKIWVQNEAVLTEEYTLTTDSIGEAGFTDLSAGRYKCRITADNHQEYIGRFWIKPAVTTTEEVFLDYNLVTVEWEVNEITIEDKYEIVLSATYETDVPAPVVVIEPASITLPPMKAGDVFNGEFTLTNYGFIRAEDLKFSLPADDQHFTYEILGGLPDTLGAKERITVPFRVTCLQSLDQEEDGDGSGGGSCYYVRCMVVDYTYQCVNGVWRWAAVQACWTYGYGDCSGLGGGGVWYVYGGGGGGGSTPVYSPQSSTMDKCFPPGERKECFAGKCCPTKETDKDNTEKTSSSVSTLMREYNRDHVDLSVKVPGGKIDVQRWYYDNRWWFEHERNRLGFTPDSLGTGIKSIDKGGVVYSASTVDSDLFIHDDIYRIRREDSGTYRWTDKSGNWKTYDDAGRMTAYGTRTGVVAKLSYEPGENGRITGYADRNDTPVFWIEYNSDGLISAVYDMENRRVEYAYSNGLLTTVTDVLENDTSYEYDGEGRIARTVDAAGRESIVTYDDYGSVASVVDSQGRGHFFEFDYDSGKKEYYARTRTSTGKIKEVWFDRFGDTRRVNVNGRTIRSIAKDGRNLIITDDIGDITRKEFDEWDNLTKVIYPDGSTAAYEYEHTFNRRTREIDENGIITEFEYDGSGNLTRKVEASGSADERVTEYTYDADGNLLTTRRIGDADTVEALTVMEYDAHGNLTSLTDPESNGTRFTSYDIMGNVLAKEDARDKTWTYEYDDAGRLKTTTDPFTNITQMFYDGAGNKIKEIDAEGTEKLFEYDVRDNLIKTTAVTDPENPESNSVTVFEYNSDSNLTKQTDAEGKMIYYQYDSEGRLTKTIDGNGNEISVEYSDTAGSGCSSCSGGSVDQPSRVIYPTFAKEFVYDARSRKTQEKDILSDTESYVTQFAYDDKGNLVSKTDKQEKTTGYVYDSLDRLKKVVDPLTGETQYTYDNRDNLIALRDANLNVTRFEYDKNNRLVKEIRPLGEETNYAYDVAGNLIQKIDAKNQKTEYVYDDAGRLTDIKYYASAGDTTPAKTVILAYDKVGNLERYDDGVTSAQYGYDDLYRKISDTVDHGTFSLSNTHTYNKNGTKKTFTGPDSVTYGYLYDANNQLAGVQIPDSGFITVNAYHWNRPANMTLPGGSTKQFDYDPLMRVKEITARDPGQNILMNYQYTYDKMDNIENKDTEHGSYAYGYDALYRLTTTDNPVQDDEAFTYDGVGNRLTAGDTAGDWTYNPNNELGGYDDVSYEYDANGNMTQKTVGGAVTKFFYNLEDRLERVEDGVGTVIAIYYYDPFGRRLWKEVSGVRTYFHYADEGLVAELDSSGNVTKSYGYKPGSTWTTDPLFMKTGPDYYFYQNDHLGTPQKLTAINGAVVWAAKYSSFGKASIEVETVKNNLRYPGQVYDEETGLHYSYHRYYDPKLGRYLTPDPIGLLGGINRFLYANSNPGNFTDPYGLWPTPIHDQIIDEAFRTAPSNLRDAIKRGSEHADEMMFQSPEYNYMHAMRRRDQSVEEAGKMMEGFVKQHLNSYECNLKAGRFEDAYYELGMALHSIMDSTSPSHEGFQIWDSVLATIIRGGALSYKLHMNAESSITPTQMKRTVDLINQALQR